MKILHVIENIDNSYGGPAKSVPYLIKFLNKMNIKNQIHSIKVKENEVNDICFDNHIEVIKSNLRGPSFIKYSNSLSENIIKELNKDTIIHTHSLWNFPIYSVFKISQKYKVPLIMSIRGNLYAWNLNKNKWKKDLALKVFQKNMFDNAQCLHATEINEYKAIRALGIKTPVALISNAIDTSEFKNLQKKEKAISDLNLNSKKRYILFMSRIDSKKGLEYLINSYIKLEKQFPNWEVLIAGPIYDKKYFENINNLISYNKLNKKIHYYGMVTGQKRLNLLSAASLFILPAHTENFGMVIGEAMASKLPVITTKGTPWGILEKEKAGWWVELNDKNITYSLNEAMNKPENELLKMGKIASEIIEKNYTWEEVSKKMRDVYSWILKKTKKPEFVIED